MSKSLGRSIAAAAGLVVLLGSGSASASWWEDGQRSYWDGAPRSHPPVAPGPVESIYGCENSDLPGTDPVLEKRTTPPAGSVVAPGDTILVEITWRTTDWVDVDLHKVIDCVYLDGRFHPELSGGERPTPNDGRFAYRYTIPLDAPAGSEICDRGFLSGPNHEEEYGRQISDLVCFPIGPPPPPPPSTPPVTAPPPPTTTTTPTGRVPDSVEPPPGPEVLPTTPSTTSTPPPAPPETQPQVLPRSGTGGTLARLASAALGLAVLLRRAARKRR